MSAVILTRKEANTSLCGRGYMTQARLARLNTDVAPWFDVRQDEDFEAAERTYGASYNSRLHYRLLMARPQGGVAVLAEKSPPYTD